MSSSTPPPINPYQPPVSESPVSTNSFPQVAGSGEFFRDGKFLVFRDRAELPLRCLINGEDVTPDAWRQRKQIVWNPPWVFIGLIGGILPLLLFMLLAQKKAHVVYSLGQKARSRIRNRKLLGGAFLLVAFGLIIAAGLSQMGTGAYSGTLVLVALIPLFIGIVILALASPIKAGGHRKGWLKLKGVSPTFLDALPQGDWKSL